MWQSTKWGKWHPDSPWGIYHGGPNLSLWSLTKLHWKKSMGRTWTQKNIRYTCCHSIQEDQKKGPGNISIFFHQQLA
jgi:hypothetical protein